MSHARGGGGQPVEVFATCPQSSQVAREDYLQQVAAVARWSEAAACCGILVYTDNFTRGSLVSGSGDPAEQQHAFPSSCDATHLYASLCRGQNGDQLCAPLLPSLANAAAVIEDFLMERSQTEWSTRQVTAKERGWE
jgi:hypothetical protein